MPRYQHLLSLGMPRAARLTGRKKCRMLRRHDGVRISFHVYNTVADVDAVLGMLQQNLELFAETPALHAD